MRLAFIGKGGTGKSMIAGTAARVLARRGHRVLALDIDTIPGLVYSLGLEPTEDGRFPEELGEKREEQGWVMREQFPVADLIERYAVQGPDGIHYLQLGKMPGRVKPGSSTAFRYVSEGLAQTSWTVIADLAGGTRQPYFGWGSFASRIAFVAEPYAAAMLTVRRLMKMAEAAPDAKIGLIINKVRNGSDLRAETSLPLWAEVPYDDAVRRAERAGKAAFDVAPDSAAVKAITDFVLRAVEAEESKK